MNEVASVYDASVSEPTQLEIDCDVFQAWTQGMKVPELVSTLKSALLAQYELEASASGSGYATLIHPPVESDSSSSSSSSDEELGAAAAATAGAGGSHQREEDTPLVSTPRRQGRRTASVDSEENDVGQVNTPRLKIRHAPPALAIGGGESAADTSGEVDEIAATLEQHLRRATAAGDASSSEDEEINATGASNASGQRLQVRSSGGGGGGHGSRRTSINAASVSKRRPHGLRSTPQLPSNSSPVAAAFSPPPDSRPVVPEPSSIDRLSSTQAHARLLWAWETQLEHQYRLYTLLEHSLKRPFLLNLHYCILQLSFQIQLQLTNLYYEFDTSFVRHLMGQKLSTNTRGNIEGILEKLKQDRLALATRQRNQSTASSSGDAAPSSGAEPSHHTQQRRASLSQLAPGLAASEDPSSEALDAALQAEPVRLTSAWRQFDNLRRIYRCRWGEKGDGVIVETDLRLDDLEVTGTGLFLPGSQKSGEKWRQMRAAAVAAMAKRGFGSTDKNAAAAAASAAALSSLPPRTLPGRVDAGGLDEFFGFDSGSQPMRVFEQTAPVFFQQQFRLHSSLARRYSRLIFLAHYRIDMSVGKRKKASELLDFQEVELIAQIIMRCWTIPIGSGCTNADGPINNKDDLKSSLTTTAATNFLSPLSSISSANRTGSLISGAHSFILPSFNQQPNLGNTANASLTTSDNLATSTLNPNMFVPPPISRLVSADSMSIAPPGGRAQSIDDGVISPTTYDAVGRAISSVQSASSVSSIPPCLNTGAAASGYDFLPVVALMKESDEDNWVGDVMDMEFIEGLKELKTYMSSRLMDDYVSAMVRCFRDTMALQLVQAQHLLPLSRGMTQQSLPTVTSPSSSTSPPLTHSTTLPVSNYPPTTTTPQGTTACASSPTTSNLIRSHVLSKLQSKLLPWLKSLHGIAISLMKNKRIRTLLIDLQEEVLKPLFKLGCNMSEVVYLMRIVRETVVSLPQLARFEIEREAFYPYAYERKERMTPGQVGGPIGGGIGTIKEDESKSSQQQPQPNRPRTNSTPSISQVGGTMTPNTAAATAAANASSSSITASDPLHRAFIGWCRFLDVIGPISVILYMKMIRSEVA